MVPDEDKFRAASEAAESWLNTDSFVAEFGLAGKLDRAFKLLLPSKGMLRSNRRYKRSQHAEVLELFLEHLRAVSDGPIKWENGRGLSAVARVPAAVYPHRWSSAHEAALRVAELAL